MYAAGTAKSITWTDEQLTKFKDEIAKARLKREAKAKEYDWDGNLERYLPKPERDSSGRATWEVNVGADFRDVERKKAALFYDVPEVSLTAADPDSLLNPAEQPQPGAPPPLAMGSLVALHQRLLNSLLGPLHANVKATVYKALFDVLCVSGIAPVKVGYDVRTVQVQAPQLDPATGQPAMNPVTLQPLLQPVEVPIHEQWFISRCSPKALLIPADFRDTDFTKAPWLGYEFEMGKAEAQRTFGLPDDAPTQSASDEKIFFADSDERSLAESPKVTGQYIEYKAEYYHPVSAERPIHPEQLCCLVLIDGVEQPVKHTFSPHQDIDPQTGRMTLTSVRGFTIRPLVTRDRTDSPYVASDCTVTGSLTRELNKYRTVTVKQRDSNRLVMLYDPEKINPDARAKIEKGDVGAWVPVEPGMLDAGPQAIMLQVGQLTQGREQWQGQDYIERDRALILGIDANQAGSTNQKQRTATETSIVQRNSEARFEQERQRVLDWFLDVVRVFDTLVLRYADANIATQVLGPQRGQVWAQHKQLLAGQYRYAIQIDSGKYLDVEANRRQLMQFLNFVGQAPWVNSKPIIARIASAFGFDPAEVIVEPPDTKPEPPKVTLSLKGEDFNPLNPQFAICVEFARQGGFTVGEESVNAARMSAERMQTEQAAAEATQALQEQESPSGEYEMGRMSDPGRIEKTVPRMPTLDSHQTRESGGLSGPGPM